MAHQVAVIKLICKQKIKSKKNNQDKFIASDIFNILSGILCKYLESFSMDI